MSGPRKVHIKSYGCQMNVYDLHRMADMLAAQGFSETAGPRMPISSSSTPATSVSEPPKKSIPSSAAFARSSVPPPPRAAR